MAPATMAGRRLRVVAMPPLDPHRAVLRHQWAEEAEALERRRQRLMAAATEAIAALQELLRLRGWRLAAPPS